MSAETLPMSNEVFAAFLLADPLAARSSSKVGELLDRLMSASKQNAELLAALEHTKQFVMAWIPEYQGQNGIDARAQLRRVLIALERIDNAIAKATGAK